MHTVYLAKLDRRTFVLLGAASVMKNSDEIVEDRFAFFARELLEQQCSGQVLPDTDYGDHAACCSIAIGDR